MISVDRAQQFPDSKSLDVFWGRFDSPDGRVRSKGGDTELLQSPRITPSMETSRQQALGCFPWNGTRSGRANDGKGSQIPLSSTFSLTRAKKYISCDIQILDAVRLTLKSLGKYILTGNRFYRAVRYPTYNYSPLRSRPRVTARPRMTPRSG